MKRFSSLIALFLALCGSLALFGACGPGGPGPGDQPAHVDYVAELKLDMTSSTLKQEVTVKTFIDGDTTHFHFPGDQFEDGVFKARYLAINTPESTGRIEEWGKKAATFTRETLSSATSILIESDDGNWNADSTGGRYLVWVWYIPEGGTEYRNLNLEILQNGLAIASNTANNRYGKTCVAALDQAKAEKLFVHSSEKDPSFPYGNATELTLTELRCNIASYDNAKVAFEGVIVKLANGSAYVVEYDAENDVYCGITVYFETAGLPGQALSFINAGNRVRFVGTVSQFNGEWQVSGLSYSMMNPDRADNLKLISEGNTWTYRALTADTFRNGTVSVTVGEESKSLPYAELSVYTPVEMRDLTVKSIYTTESDSPSSNGAMTLTCESADGLEVVVRTSVLRNEAGELVTAETFRDARIDVKGIIEYFEGAYQIQVFTLADVTIY